MERDIQYFLKIAALGEYPILRINQKEFDEITHARKVLAVALSIEEKYDLALCNFVDFEKELLTLAAERMITTEFDYDHAYVLRSALNRKIVNFITAGKIYTEQIASNASKCAINEGETLLAIEELKKSQYEACLDYRTMEVLRNHIHHSGTAVHTLSLPTHWSPGDDNRPKQLEFNIDIYSEKKILSENTGFNRRVLRDLPDRFDLKRAARSYISAISLIHEQVRKLTNENINKCRSTIEDYLTAYKLLNDGKSFALGAYAGKSAKPIMMHLDWDDIRIKLSNKNRSITNMKKRYVTNTITSK